jgi:hypothetical protein
MSHPLLPPSLPDKERRADYDFEIRHGNIHILPRQETPPADDCIRRYWYVGICRADFGITRVLGMNRYLSHWGVYFQKAPEWDEHEQRHFNPLEVSITSSS